MLIPKLYEKENVKQCWSCAHQVGQSAPDAYCSFEKERNNIEYLVFPECDKLELYMTHVNQNPCPYYQRKSK